jgi:exopolyphosphatase/guanosine-5'-triphosphate,3'-diphosphate pyrophosphatase
MPASSAAVIDIGSNSIKILVAARTPSRGVTSLAARTLDARISAGISRARPALAEDGMQRGLAAIQELLAFAAPFKPEHVVLVATSAVRDASNGGEFRARVRTATGQDVRILSGDEEANLIGRGLTCDPALQALRDFYVFDLGGGSLECLAFHDRRIAHAASLQLGCVRLTERLVRDSGMPLPSADRAEIRRHVLDALGHSSFPFSLSADAAVVGTGGTLTTARAILAAQAGRSLDATDTLVTVAQLQQIFADLAAMPLAERRQVAGLPAARADVFPTALATLVALAEFGKFSGYRNSLYNLRWGLAAEVLAGD